MVANAEERRANRAPSGHFYRLAVLPAWRRRGIALQLVREGEALLRAAGAKRLAAIALVDHEDAVGFWEAAGFERQVEAGRFTKLA
jgi:ribosomal protein S18 acetylase RimI-like enzyme